MPESKRVLSFDVEVSVEQREGYFAANTRPFAITVYGDTEDEAEEKALKAVTMLIDVHSKTTDDLSNYLMMMGIKHTVKEEGMANRPRSIVRECRREMRAEASVGV